jgi:FkbM family methyltransferase
MTSSLIPFSRGLAHGRLARGDRRGIVLGTKVRSGERSATKWLSAPFQRRQYQAVLAAARICSRPFDLLRRYATASGNYPASITLRTPIGQISLNVYSWHDTRTIHEIFLVEDYRIGNNKSIIVDYGSNIGISAAYFLSRNEKSFAYLFEPVPKNVERLRYNLRRFEGRYHLKEVAVAVNEGKAKFGIEETGRYGGLNKTTGQYVEVDCLESNSVLDDIISNRGDIDVLKIDVETMERVLVEHLTVRLASKIRLLFAETRFESNILNKTHRMSVQGTVSRFQHRNINPT